MLRLETHLLPLWRLDDAFEGAFQYFARGVERHGRESTLQMFHLTTIESAYVSGRVLYRGVARAAEERFQTVALLQNPYDELAERLLVLARANKNGLETLGMRDSLSFRGAAAFASALPTGDVKELKRALRRMPDDVATIFANPLVRQLTTNNPDEMPAQGAVAAALDALSGFALVGMREDPELFLKGFAELAGLDARSLPAPPRFATVAAFAERLRETGEVDGILEKDRELHHYLTQAVAAARAAPDAT